MNNNRTTILLSSSRSWTKLSRAIKHLNDGLYGDDIYKDDRIDFNPVMSDKGDLLHFEITGSPLDFFQIGLRYGAMEEKECMQPYLKDFYKDAVSRPLETSAL